MIPIIEYVPGMKISEPGIYVNVPAELYHGADLWLEPMLSQSIVKTIVEYNPRTAWIAHPKLNPNFEGDDPSKYDIGNLAHTRMLGRGKQERHLDYPDWKTKAAREDRDAALEDGAIGVLLKDVDRADAMVAAGKSYLDLSPEWNHIFKGPGYAEAVVVWRDGGINCKQMIDWLPADMLNPCDYKTTKMCVAEHAIGRKMMTDDWGVQAHMAERGLTALDPSLRGRLKFWFVAQEDEDPFGMTVSRLPASALIMGRKKIDRGMNLWARALHDNHWPTYPVKTLSPDYPTYAETKVLEREVGEWSEDDTLYAAAAAANAGPPPASEETKTKPGIGELWNGG